MGVITMSNSIQYGPIMATIFFLIIETIAAVIIYGAYRLIYKYVLKKATSWQGTWKKYLLLLGTVAVMFGTAIWALQFSYNDPQLDSFIKLHFAFFPVVLATALFYFIKSPNHSYYFMKTPMRYIFGGYVLLEVMLGVFVTDEYLSIMPMAISGIYLVVAGISLLLGPHKKEAAVTDDDSQSTQTK